MAKELELLFDAEIPPSTVPAGTLVTARSYLIDRIAPDCEIVALPEARVSGGILRLMAGPIEAAPPPRRRGLHALARPPRETAPDGRWLIDLRHNDPSNWAHFLNNHLPLAFWASKTAEIDPDALLVLLPADTPGYIRTAAHLFGLEIRATNAVVSGQGLLPEVTPWTALRPARAGWARSPQIIAALSSVFAGTSATHLPRKIFLSRRKTRALENAAEIENLLAQRGFSTVYPEDLTVADQLRLFSGAEEIVAVHGAGLAPLLYCDPEAAPRRLIELLAPGHMTNVYRAMAAEKGVHWIGVRGQLKPEYIIPAYRFDTSFRKYSLDNFQLDSVSLERAFTITNGNS